MTGNILRYRGYYTKILYSAHDKTLHGKIEGINEVVEFECTSAESIEDEFHAAVDEYIYICKELGEAPEKAYSGMFNVRISPELHKRLSFYAFNNGKTLNKATEEAIEEFTTLHKLEKHQ